MVERNKLIEGPIIKSLISLSIPIIFANILQTAYQLTDTFWVGRLSTIAVAAVSISFPVIFLVVSFGIGIAIAGTILVAQYRGRNDKKSVDYITTQTMIMVTFISIFLSLIGYMLSPFFINLMGAKKEVFPGAVSYLKISFIGMIFIFIYMAFQSLMRGVGDVKTPMYIVLGTVLLNLVLDPLFIFGFLFIPPSGVTGAAIATVFTQSIAAFIGIYLLLKGKHQIIISTKYLKPDFKLFKRMLKLGIPASIEQSTRAFGMTVMTILVASFGTYTLAAYGIGIRILSFIVIPALGLSMASSTLVGQNIGAGKTDRAEEIVKLSSLLGFLALSFVGILVFIFGREISTLFIPGDLKTIETSIQFIKIMALTFGFIGVQMALNGAFRGSGNTLISMSLSLISLWGLRFPLAFFLSKFTKLSELGLWLAFPIANVITSFIAIFWFLKGTWKRKELLKPKEISQIIEDETIIEEGLNE